MRIPSRMEFSERTTTLDDLARASFPAHMGRASSWPNALADREPLSWLCLQTRFRQILEGARIVDRLVAKLLQRFSGERRAPARCAIEDDGLLLPKSRIVVWAFGVGTELQHAARHVNCAFDLAAGSQLRRVTNVDNDNIALAHPVSEIGGLNPRHDGIGSGQHILHTRRHGFTPVFPRKLWGGHTEIWSCLSLIVAIELFYFP